MPADGCWLILSGPCSIYGHLKSDSVWYFAISHLLKCIRIRPWLRFLSLLFHHLGILLFTVLTKKNPKHSMVLYFLLASSVLFLWQQMKRLRSSLFVSLSRSMCSCDGNLWPKSWSWLRPFISLVSPLPLALHNIRMNLQTRGKKKKKKKSIPHPDEKKKLLWRMYIEYK